MRIEDVSPHPGVDQLIVMPSTVAVELFIPGHATRGALLLARVIQKGDSNHSENYTATLLCYSPSRWSTTHLEDLQCVGRAEERQEVRTQLALFQLFRLCDESDFLHFPAFNQRIRHQIHATRQDPAHGRRKTLIKDTSEGCVWRNRAE